MANKAQLPSKSSFAMAWWCICAKENLSCVCTLLGSHVNSTLQVMTVPVMAFATTPDEHDTLSVPLFAHVLGAVLQDDLTR